ncbi:UDP-N-acetylmuramoyl-L-alanine--D-glutamate ligase [Pradoshia sp. D12]|uniref:UDP-N-acetylmuramoyl-L-alanine--D-glutamate ligase n=1 Tax=Bacillaceae TaxID=186817 RepID=UPI00112CC2E2|nr:MULTISPECIES: UDP-N-acetylmuramoyl-L-alanine--D-glutamate ligase [Bacillaceae]QFK70894.1 UDP-N-acetylmuramoyl-L-alanine--D-glutamate ligase [Pradoshia sp. D12]TPF72686.1 UDP-N-acetylmuramoyl-L-alanine--D-glutamate ligase [Bacillus sp. D12]
MKQINDYLRKKVLVLGLAKSGVSAASLLHKLGAFVTVNDFKPLNENPEAQGLLEEGIKVVCGSHPIELLDEGFELIVKNPGIPYTNPMIQEALKKNLEIITEVELAYRISEAPFIGITGTNGKTTTTTLIYEMLERGGKKPLIAGNIGTVASGVAQEATAENVIVIELSSFQLMGIQTFRPYISVYLNLFDAHLDYHGTKEEYAFAKAQITKNQKDTDFIVYNANQEPTKKAAEGSGAISVPFSTEAVDETGAYTKDGFIWFKNEKIIAIDEVVLPGKHNLENILSAVAAVKLYGVANEAIQDVLKTFSGVKHRTQFVAEINGRKFYNDSKATNILAASAAISSFKSPLILLAGGLDRGNEFDELIPLLTHVKAMIVFGETAEKLTKTAQKAGISIIKHVDNVAIAANEAYKLSESGDTILLSPACASWDQYKTFEARGDMFMDAVHKLK